MNDCYRLHHHSCITVSLHLLAKFLSSLKKLYFYMCACLYLCVGIGMYMCAHECVCVHFFLCVCNCGCLCVSQSTVFESQLSPSTLIEQSRVSLALSVNALHTQVRGPTSFQITLCPLPSILP